MSQFPIKIGSIISGPILPESVEVLSLAPYGGSLKIVGRGLRSGRTYAPILNTAQIGQLEISADTESFDGDARLFRLGVEAHRLGLAYEYDPFFSDEDDSPRGNVDKPFSGRSIFDLDDDFYTRSRRKKKSFDDEDVD